MTKDEYISVTRKAYIAQHALLIDVYGMMRELSQALGNDNIPNELKKKIQDTTLVVLKNNNLFERITSVRKLDDDAAMVLFAN